VTGVIDPPLPPRNWEGMGIGMGINGEWQTCNDSWTIREYHSPNGKANDHGWVYHVLCFWKRVISFVGFIRVEINEDF